MVPTVGIVLPTDDREIEPFLRRLAGEADYVVFMTATGTRVMMGAAERMGLKEAVLASLGSPRVAVVARSWKPRGELAKWGVKVDASPSLDEATAEGVVNLLEEKGIRGRRVAILWHGSRNAATRERLLAAGAREVCECLAYRYSRSLEADGAGVLGSMGFSYRAPDEEAVIHLVEEIVGATRPIDALTFTSPPAAANLFEVAADLGEERSLAETLSRGKTAVVAVGPSTRRELEEGHGVKVQVMPEVPAMGAMMNALAEYAVNREGHRRPERRLSC